MTTRPLRFGLLAALTLVLMTAAPSAQQKQLTLDDIYGPTSRVNFSGEPAPAIEWIDGSHYAWARPATDGRGAVDWLNVSADTGATSPLFDAARAEAALAALPGVGSDQAGRLVHSRDLIFNHTYSAALLTIDDDLYGLSFPDGRALRLTSAVGEEEEPAFSPDGSKVAFVRNHNLFVVDTQTARETALTSDGAAKILNGEMDWVYEEEIYGRGTKRAFWWSPDSSKVAFLRIDDTPVSTFVTLDDINYDPNVETWQYPRAGEANPTVRLGVARVAGGTDWSGSI
jgi:dipeptidyl-peptidase-4